MSRCSLIALVALVGCSPDVPPATPAPPPQPAAAAATAGFVAGTPYNPAAPPSAWRLTFADGSTVTLDRPGGPLPGSAIRFWENTAGPGTAFGFHVSYWRLFVDESSGRMSLGFAPVGPAGGVPAGDASGLPLTLPGNPLPILVDVAQIP